VASDRVRFPAIVFPERDFVHKKENTMDISQELNNCLELQEIAERRYAHYLEAHKVASDNTSRLLEKLRKAGIDADFHEVIDGTVCSVHIGHDSRGGVPGDKIRLTPIIPLSQKI
jgi:fatty acid-binding protein DegV